MIVSIKLLRDTTIICPKLPTIMDKVTTSLGIKCGASSDNNRSVVSDRDTEYVLYSDP